MEARKPVFGKSNSVEDMQHVRLMALLQELEREHGRKGAAAVLSLDHWTLSASGSAARRREAVMSHSDSPIPKNARNPIGAPPLPS